LRGKRRQEQGETIYEGKVCEELEKKEERKEKKKEEEEENRGEKRERE
jgi:hypothetical protein